MDIQEIEMKKINSILNDIGAAVKQGAFKKFKDLIMLMQDIDNKTLLHDCYNSQDIDLISIICSYNKKKFLRYLLYQSHILHCLSYNDKSKDKASKENSFYYAMKWSNCEMLEMIYDHWSGDLHWLGHKKEYDNFDIENLEELNVLLINALNKYDEDIKVKKKVDKVMLCSVYSIVSFNHFQRRLYRKLNELKNALVTTDDEPEDVIRIQETFAIRNMIVTILEYYEKHSMSVEIWFKDNFVVHPDDLLERLTNTSTLLWKTYFYINYEMYFRKLDSNVCLLILDNLHLLKLRLSMPKDSYQNLENKLYQFIYHINTKWSLYMPRRKKMKVENEAGMYSEIPCVFTVTYDANKLERAAFIMYLQRRDFEKTLKCFQEQLQSVNVRENIRRARSQLPHEDNNCLVLLPELRDYYSLKKISQHISQLYSVKVSSYGFLLIERTLQVLGEFLKSSKESLHLQGSTEALVKAELSVALIEDLKKLRDLFSHVKNGELLKRIELEIYNRNIFETIRKELLCVRHKIHAVIKHYQPLVQKALLVHSMSLLYDKFIEIPDVAGRTLAVQLTILESFVQNPDAFQDVVGAPLQYFKSIGAEIIAIFVMSLIFKSKLREVNKSIHKNIIDKFNFFKARIICSLREIAACKLNWQRLVTACADVDSNFVFSDYPNEKDINRMKSFKNKSSLANNFLNNFIDNRALASITNHWQFIINLLEFVVVKTSIFDEEIGESEKSILLEGLKELNESDYTVNDIESIVFKFLEQIEKHLKPNPTTGNATLYPAPELSGIKELISKLGTVNFLTEEEKECLRKALENTSGKGERKAKEMMEKINKDIAIPKKTYNDFLASVKLDKKDQIKLNNLVMGNKRDPLLPQCLKRRVDMLRDITKDHCKDQLVLRYKLDKTFRVLLEVLLIDIFNTLKNKRDEGLKKSKLLTEMRLRNILAHGSPILEVVGGYLDADDLPTELVTRALQFSEDGRSIDALCALIDLHFDFAHINSGNLSPELLSLVSELKTSARWEEYLQLAPARRRAACTKHDILQPPDAIHVASMQLLEAVKKKDYLLMEESISAGGDVNFTDRDGRAGLHHAAMKGDARAMGILLRAGADVSARDARDRFTALHYSAMNGFEHAVELLLARGAACLALDARGRSPLYLANQRDRVAAARLLARAARAL